MLTQDEIDEAVRKFQQELSVTPRRCLVQDPVPPATVAASRSSYHVQGDNSTMILRIANSPRMLLAVFIGVMLGASTLYAIFEGASFLDSVYWALVTATTLGYGDFSPHSVFGKVLTGGLIMFTVFILIPTITANVAAGLIVDRDAFTHEEQEQIKGDLAEVLALLKQAPTEKQ